MLKIKTVLKTAPATQDEEYDRRKRGMKELGPALRSYRSAMAKAKASVNHVVESLGKVCKVFDTLSNDPNIPNCTKDCTLALTASMDRIEGALLSGFNAAMDSTVLSAVDELKAMYDECAKLEPSATRSCTSMMRTAKISAKKSQFTSASQRTHWRRNPTAPRLRSGMSWRCALRLLIRNLKTPTTNSHKSVRPHAQKLSTHS
ncbi:hypothetical_protein (plasmid) [Leishmania braziliensis MHOM/BR/75/M2904]|uniref:Hypothetical_protein n=1 Tax=Leishmania braziliensis MHOM/BR/75/M2904 TaxID=420245 RepID=A0A3P3Z630_LEIBR|nr:hypothetical_protein [Leishmania braziliensis MHOM/BR/75/M2904]